MGKRIIKLAAVLLLTIGILSQLSYGQEKSEAYIRLVNATRNYVQVILYVGGEKCCAAPQGDQCVCPVAPGTHQLMAEGITAKGERDTVSRTVQVQSGTFTWTIEEKR